VGGAFAFRGRFRDGSGPCRATDAVASVRHPAEKMPAARASDDAVEAAIARVLDAEHRAHDAITGAQEAAAAMIDASRAAARSLAERTERRIGTIRATFERHATAAVAALDATGHDAEARHDLTPQDEARLAAAVDALAAQLTER
jgi:hypothetical protein